MNRRTLLAAVGGAVSLAGCAGRLGTGGSAEGDSSGENGSTGSEPGNESVETLTLAEQGVPPTICEESLSSGGIQAIGEPAFGTPGAFPTGPEGYHALSDEDTVIGLTDGQRARAYPRTVLNVHEIVNDTFGAPVIVTYCPICRSGMVAKRRVDGETTTFDVSGLLWKAPRIHSAASEKDGRVFSDNEAGVANNGNLVMYDAATGSYWSQILAAAICGERQGERMTIHPSTVTTWGEWRRDHPDTEVLLPPPASETIDPPI